MLQLIYVITYFYYANLITKKTRKHEKNTYDYLLACVLYICFFNQGVELFLKKIFNISTVDSKENNSPQNANLSYSLMSITVALFNKTLVTFKRQVEHFGRYLHLGVIWPVSFVKAVTM